MREWSASEPGRLVRSTLRRSLLREAAVSVGPLVAITIGFALVPLRGTVARPAVLAVLLVVTVSAAGLGGVSAGCTTAVASAFVVDFSHTRPYELLSLPTVLRSLALFGTMAVLVGARAASFERNRRR